MSNPASLQNPSESGVSEAVINTEADLSAALYCFAASDSPNQVQAATSGNQPLGVFQDAPKAASGAPQGATIRTAGQTRLKLGGNVTQGDFLKPTTGGAAVTADTDKDKYGAIALEDGETGDFVLAQVVFGTLSK